MSNPEREAAQVIALQATMIAVIKELRAQYPQALDRVQAAAEKEVREMTPPDSSLERATLASLREILFLKE